MELKYLHFRGIIMYQFKHNHEEFENFILPFGGKLKSSNRWAILGKAIKTSLSKALLTKTSRT